MTKSKREHPKREALRRTGTLHPHPDQVKDPLFHSGDFFDSQDSLQVKYEMLRRVQVEKHPIGRAAQAFGFSRPSVYHAAAAFKRNGLAGLVRAKPGPRNARKLSVEVMDFIEAELREGHALPARELVKRVAKRFGLTIHARSIERALARKKKNGADSALDRTRRSHALPGVVSALYEQMRAEALEGRHVFMRSPGLGTFLRDGMWAWADVCLERGPGSGDCRSGSAEGSLPVAAGDCGDLKMVLAELIQGTRFEGRN